MSLLPRFTDRGKALQLRALDGEQIVFTKIQMGSGKLGVTSYKTFNALIDPKVTVPITDVSVSDGYAAVRGYFNNENITEGFYYRELGLFAKDPDDETKEILYAYGNTGEHASYIAEPSSRLIERSIKVIAVVDDAENVSAIINGSAVYVDFTDMRTAIEEHNSDANAHAEMRNQSLTMYIDCSSTEDNELCDGSFEHPYKDLDDALYAVPMYIHSLYIILKTPGDYHASDIYIGWGELREVSISNYGGYTNKPVIRGSFSFGALDKVTISNVKFLCDGSFWSSNYSRLVFDDCRSVSLSYITTECKTSDGCLFADIYSSNVYICNSSILNMYNAFNLFVLSSIHICNSEINTIDASIFCDNSSTVFSYDNNEISYEYEAGALLFTPDIIEKITDGSIINHLSSTANPHRVTLNQAQQEGGRIDVAHGGTGQTTFTKGAILKGNGSDAIAMLTGTGAVYATKSGEPQFGTLPVNMGGTGNTSFTKGAVLLGAGTSGFSQKIGEGAFYAPSSGNPLYGTLPVKCGGTGMTSASGGNIIMGGGTNMPMKELAKAAGALFCNGAENQYGVLPKYAGGTGQNFIHYGWHDNAAEYYRGRHVQFIVPGTDVLVWAGRVDVSAGNTFDCHMSWCGDKTFVDDKYALIFSYGDIKETDCTKYPGYFQISSQAIGSRVGSFIAIGKVAS